MAKHSGISVRFYPDREDHQRAWQYLQEMDTEEYPSKNQVIIEAILDYFDNSNEEAKANLYYSDQLMPIITDAVDQAVENAVERVLPAFLSGCIAGLSVSTGRKGYETPQLIAVSSSSTAISDDEIEESGLDMDFLAE
ncbi:MAG: hypothetical protein UHP11_00910 [Anaerovoracaceae bacterium]|jgi:hypothetical protein|nr:hypothetical protein [Anaerovoracaceae bacterium]